MVTWTMRRLAATGTGERRGVDAAGACRLRPLPRRPEHLAFFEMLPDVDGPSGLHVGCGEGHNTRLLAERGARMTGIDISRNFIRYAREAEAARPLGIRYE